MHKQMNKPRISIRISGSLLAVILGGCSIATPPFLPIPFEDYANDNSPPFPPGNRGGMSQKDAHDLARGIRHTADVLGVSPYDLAAIISYETAGTMNPLKVGPSTKWGVHRGLIQWGEPQSRDPKYWGSGKCLQNSSISEQMEAVTRYLQQSGVRPGMKLIDLYSAVNAGTVGKYNANDGNGTVAIHASRITRGHSSALDNLEKKAELERLVKK